MNAVLRRLVFLSASLQRNFPYPIKGKAFDLPPLHGAGPATLLTICRESGIADAAWALYGWMFRLGNRLRPVLVVDGRPPAEAVAGRFRRLFPGIEIRTSGEVLEGMSPFSESRGVFYRDHVFGRKVATVFACQRTAPVLFTDPDILLFRRPDQVADALDRGGVALYSRNNATYAVDPWTEGRFRARGIPVERDFNSGILLLPKGSVDEDLVEGILEGWSDSPRDHFTEQTLFSGLMGSLGGTALDGQRYIARLDGLHPWKPDCDYAPLVARHFVGPVRHRMYQKGIPYFLERLREDGGLP